MHGPDKTHAWNNLVAVYGRDQLNGMNYYHQYRYAYDKAHGCKRDMENLRRTCTVEEQNHRNRENARIKAEQQQFTRDLYAKKNDLNNQEYEMLKTIDQHAVKVVEHEQAIIVANRGLRERKDLMK